MAPRLDPAIANALRQLDLHLNPLWQLGKNAVLAWTQRPTGLGLLLLPVYDLLACLSQNPALLRGTRYRDKEQFSRMMDLVSVEPIEIISSIRIGSAANELPWQTVERVIRRYSINEVPHRAVLLFDIVAFSKASPIQQIGQLNALEYALNISHQRMKGWGIKAEIARSTTGDGCYVWNRELGVQADVNLLILAILTLMEIEITRTQDRHGLTPTLRTAYSIGRHYSYHQVEGLSPRGYDYIVGDVTIILARLIAKASANQILIGAFERPLHEGASEVMDAGRVVMAADKLFKKLKGQDIGGQVITDIRLGLGNNWENNPARLEIEDKHGMFHRAYNARAEIHRGGRFPVLLGIDAAHPQAAAMGGM